MTQSASASPRPFLTPERRDTLLWSALIFLLTLLAYQPAFHASFVWDDDRHVVNNRFLHTAEGLEKIWFHPSTGRTLSTFVTPQYYPLTHTTYWIEYHLASLNPTLYHIDNAILQAIAAILFWRVLLTLGVPGAWVAAAVFAIHPIEVESVAWVTERKNVLSGVFFFASILSYLRFTRIHPRDSATPLDWRWYAASLAFFTLAILSKTVASVMPAVMILLLLWKRPRPLLPFFALLPFFILGLIASSQTAYMEQHIVGAIGPEWDLTLSQHIMVAARAFWFYPTKLLLPISLSFNYPCILPDNWNPLDIIRVLATLTVLLLSLTLLLKRRLLPVAVAILAYTLMLIPALGFVHVYPMRYSFVADHFQYLAGSALIALVIGLIARNAAPNGIPPRTKFPQSAAAILLLTFAILTFHQSTLYSTPFDLWKDTIAKNPRSWMAYDNLGKEFDQLASQQLRDADPEAAAHSLLQSADNFRHAVEIRPDHAAALTGLGHVLDEQGNPTAAIETLHRSLAIDPKSPIAHSSLAIALIHAKRLPEARTEFKAALALAPDFWTIHREFALLLLSTGDTKGAYQEFSQVVALHPTDALAHFQLATLLAVANQRRAALPHAYQAVQLSPNNPEYLTTLAYLYTENGYPQEAFNTFNRALTLDPKNPRALEGAQHLLHGIKLARDAATRASTQSTTRPATTRSSK